MPSELKGLFKTLIWDDYKPFRPGAKPKTVAQFAFTSTTPSRDAPSFLQVPGSKPAVFELDDNFTVGCKFNAPVTGNAPGSTFAMGWIFTDHSQSDQKHMLRHEQGHYNITALICRDFFVDVMLLKGQTFASQQAGLNKFHLIRSDSFAKIRAVHALYDTEVHPEHTAGNFNGTKQQEWNGFFQTAFDQARVPASHAPGGKPHKVKLIVRFDAGGGLEKLLEAWRGLRKRVVPL